MQCQLMGTRSIGELMMAQSVFAMLYHVQARIEGGPFGG